MAANKKQEPVIPFGQFVDNELTKRGSTRRWLMAQLVPLKITLTDTQLSNRCKGHIPFSEEEIAAIEKVLEVEYSK